MADGLVVQFAEVRALDLVHGTRLLQRRWKILLAATAGATLIAVAVSFVVPPLWESAVDIQIGTLDGEPIEDPRSLARIIESGAIAQDLPGDASSIRQPLRTQVVIAMPGAVPERVAYLRVLARGRTADDARAYATQALEFVKRRHAELSQKTDDLTRAYEEGLARAVAELQDSMAKLESLLVGSQSMARDSTLAAVLFQTQLESTRTEFLKLSKELRESQVKRTLGTKETRELAPPTAPQRPIWPSAVLFAVVGAGLGLVIGALGVLLFG